MKALILAAGEGTRLRPLTAHCPKPMLPVGGRPMMEHLLRLLIDHGVSEVAINLHYKPRAIVDHFGDGTRFGARITYSYEDELLGSAGAARKLSWFLDERFVVLYGDVLTDIDLTAFAHRHVTSDAEVTLALYQVEDPSRCGMVETDGDGRVQRFIEKPASYEPYWLANAGIYIAEPSILSLVPDGSPFDFGQNLFPDLLQRGRPIYAYATQAYVLDIGSPERYAQAEADFANGRFRPSVHRQLVGGLTTC